MINMLTHQEANDLFSKFSHPLVKAAVTKHQKKVSIGIAKILWLSLVKGIDTEQDIYNNLSGVLNNKHESIISIGSLYFFKMKKALTEKELKDLRGYYNIDDNFDSLENWIDELQ